MNKEQILQLTGLSEDDFYNQYPDQESFCQDYPDMCPEMIYDDSLYEAQDGVETTAPYTDYNQYKNAMQTYGNEASKAATYNSFQNDLYNQSGKTRGFSETFSQLGQMFNTLSPEQQDALAQKYNAEFITNTPSANRKNYINSMEMNIPGKGMGYYSFPTNDVVYGRKVLERPDYEFPKLTMTPYQSEDHNKPIQILDNLVNLYKNPSFLNSKNGKSPIEKYSLNKTVEKVGAANKYISKPIVSPSTNYTSIVDLLKSRGEDSSFESRKKLAEEAGIKNYIGTASQNMKLLNSFNNNEMKHGGIHINPANKGKFTSWAQAHGMGVQEAASHVMANKEDYSSTIVKRANFARNASKWKHEEGGELEQYQDKGQVNFRDQLFQRNKPIIDASAAPILLPPNLNYDKKRVVNSSSAGLNKNQLKQVYKNLKTKADAEKKQEIEEYEASDLFHKYNPVAQFLGTRSAPVSSVKPTPRELAYGLGAGINEFYDVPNIGIVNDFVNPLSMVSKGIISPWTQAPLQAQQSDSYLPYGTAALSTGLTAWGLPEVTSIYTTPLRAGLSSGIKRANQALTYGKEMYPKVKGFTQDVSSAFSKSVDDLKFLQSGKKEFQSLKPLIKQTRERLLNEAKNTDISGKIANNEDVSLIVDDLFKNFGDEVISSIGINNNFRNLGYHDIRSAIDHNVQKVVEKVTKKYNFTRNDLQGLLANPSSNPILAEQVFNDFVNTLPNEFQISRFLKSQKTKEQLAKIYNSQADKETLKTFIKNRGKFSYDEAPINFTPEDQSIYKAIRELGKFRKLLKSNRRNEALKHPDVIEKLKKLLPQVDKETAAKTLNTDVSTMDDLINQLYGNNKQGIPNNVTTNYTEVPSGYNLESTASEKLTSLNPQGDPSFVNSVAQAYNKHFGEKFPFTAEPYQEYPTSLIDISKNSYGLKNDPVLGVQLVDEGTSPRIQFVRAKRQVTNAPKGETFIGSYSLSTDSYPITNQLGLNLVEQKIVEPKYAGEMMGLNPMGYANDQPGLSLREINSQILKLEQLSGKKFPKAKYINNQYRVPKIYFERLKMGGQYEKGGHVFPAMRTMFKHGGYYGMDGKFHPNSDSGTYVGGAGYYFNLGGDTIVTPSTTPGAGGNPIDITTPNSFAYSNPNVPDANGFYPDGSFRVDQNENYNFDNQNETDPYMTGDFVAGLEKDDDDKFNNTFDDSQYSNQIDPNTGFTTWSKNNKVIRNIKKEDPALWENLKEKGNGARWETGQTDFQRVGRTVGKIGQGLESAINVAGAIGGYLSNRQKQQNLDKSAMNKGSTASMFTNPEGSSKGDYGVTGSAYGMFKPNQMGNYSFKGMYGKYGMEVPKYQIGGGFSNLFANAQTASPILNPIELASNIPIQAPVIFPTDNTRVYQDNQSVQYNFSKPLGKGLDVSGDPKLMKELFTYAQNKYGTPDKKKIKGINEMAWNPMGVYNDGVYNPKGNWKNHDGHIHFGFENPDVAVDIIEKAQALGLRASENPYLSGKKITKGHTKGSFHYSNFNANDYKTTFENKNVNTPIVNNKSGNDVATKLNNPGNILYHPAFENFGAVKSKINATDSGKPFAAFPSIEMGLKAREAQLFGEVDGTFSSKYYKPNTDIDKALKKWSNGGYGVEIYPELKGKTLSQITAAERKELQRRQIKKESDAMYKKLQQAGYYQKFGGEQFGGQVVEMDENEIQQFLAAGGQLEFID